MNERDLHMRIQEFLDGELSPAEEKAFRAELERNESLRSEFETWSTFFDAMDGLPAVEPTSGFSERVLANLQTESIACSPAPERAGWWARLRTRLRRGAARAAGITTVTPELLQDFLDGSLSTGLATRVAARIEADPELAAQAAAMERVFGALGSLSSHRPAPGFAEGVMARVDVRPRQATVRPRTPALAAAGVTAVSNPGVLDRVWKRVRQWVPDRRQGIAVAAGVAVTPLVTFSALAYSIMTHPQFRPSQLGAYLSLKGSGALETVGGWLYNLAASFGMTPAVDFVQSQSSALPMVGLGFVVMSVVCLWILYRNVVASRPVDVRYVQLSL